ncbi:unnamed protein product [Penicillium palitans]
MAQRIADGQQDNLHILSEFEDPERRELIARIAQDPQLAQLARQNMWALWFSDMDYRPDSNPGNNNVLFYTETGARIHSGYVFTVKTDNKEKRPLSSMELLELRWHLSRILHMRGGGEDEDSDYESDGGSVSVRSGSRSPVKKEK